MQERGRIEPIVERVVGQVLDSYASQLRAEIVRGVMEAIAAEPGLLELPSTSSGSRSDSAELAQAVAEIQMGTSQKEILRALLDTSARYATRVALFVVKGGGATGWQGRGFDDCDAVKDFALDENAPAISGTLRGRVSTRSTAGDLDARFVQKFGAPVSGESRILPLMLKDKIAALIYADSGSDAGDSVDAGSLELLVLSTSAWLEVNSLRKQAQKEPAAPQENQSAKSSEAHQSAVHAVSVYSDPFASHPTAHPAVAMAASASAAAASSSQAIGVAETAVSDNQVHGNVAESTAAESIETTPEMHSQQSSAEAITAHASAEATMEAITALPEFQSEVVEMNPAPAEPWPTGNDPIYDSSSPHSADLTSTDRVANAPASPISSMSPEDQDVHHKAQRFARLLVDEIKLYNQAKVVEGRNNSDLYDRLKEVIEKSRITYQKRYGTTVASSANYFQHEIIRSLAEDDVSIMGANFRQ